MRRYKKLIVRKLRLLFHEISGCWSSVTSSKQNSFFKSLQNTEGEEEKPPALVYFYIHFFEVEKTITSWALRRPSYFNYIVPMLPRPISHPFPQPLPFTNTHTHTHQTASHYTPTSLLPAPCNYTIGRQLLFLGSVNVWLLLTCMRLSEQAGVFHYKIFNNLSFIVRFRGFMICRRLLELKAFPVPASSKKRLGAHSVLCTTGVNT